MSAKITTECKCGRKVSVSADRRGITFRCPLCRHAFTIPGAPAREESDVTDGAAAAGPKDPGTMQSVRQKLDVAAEEHGQDEAEPGPAAAGAGASELICDKCQYAISLEVGHLGKVVKCPKCLHTMPVPPGLRAEPQDTGRMARLLASGASIKRSSSSAVVCQCTNCGTRYVLGVNATIVTSEELMKELAEKGDGLAVGKPSSAVPDKVALVEGHESWPDGQEPPEPTQPVSSHITLARDRQESRQWRCGQCLTVQRYEWLH